MKVLTLCDLRDLAHGSGQETNRYYDEGLHVVFENCYFTKIVLQDISQDYFGKFWALAVDRQIMSSVLEWSTRLLFTLYALV
jgi:hypothetical protein